MGVKFAVVKEQGSQQVLGDQYIFNQISGVSNGNKSYGFSKWWDTLEEAQVEAERLARKEGDAFIVIKTVGIAKPVNPPIEFSLL